MKNILNILAVLCLVCLTQGCSDFLEKEPGVDVTEDTIFSSKTQLETFVVGTYYYTLLTDQLAYWDARGKDSSPNTGATDECDINASWFPVNTIWNVGSVTSTQTGDYYFNVHWTGLRRVNTIIERVDAAPFDDPAYKRQAMGEALFLRAYVHFQLFEKYGGFPLMKRRYGPGDDFAVGRNTVKEVVDYIVEDCDNAYELLPHHNEYPSNQRGRATKAAALALKARTLLYAASKTFNTSQPYLDFGENNELICYGNYDVERWKLAADAAKAAIEEAEATGLALVTNQGVDKNYRYVWEVNDNSEIILAEKNTGMRYTGHFPWSYYLPVSYGYWMTWDFMKKYERIDGTQQPWSDAGGENLMDIFENMDPRFKQTVVYQGQDFNADHRNLDYAYNGNTPGRYVLGACCQGAIVHKPCPATVQATGNVGAVPNGLIFKLSELYLNYAEALNEYYDTPTPEAYQAVNDIRARSGMPSLPDNLTKEQFRERVRNERAIELAFDGLRFWDIRRWEIAEEEGVMSGEIYGIKQYKIPGSTEIRYEPYVYETRSFKKAMYRHPFPQTEINKGYLIQNPGY